jgi:hypothetical protein
VSPENGTIPTCVLAAPSARGSARTGAGAEPCGGNQQFGSGMLSAVGRSRGAAAGAGEV